MSSASDLLLRLKEAKYHDRPSMIAPCPRTWSPLPGVSHHVGTEIAEEHRAERAGEDPRQIDDADAGERLVGHPAAVRVSSGS